jgi:SAM-dependent methyltransferase
MWHEDDQFWQAMAPFVFDAQRWLEASTDVEQIVKLVGLAPPASVLDLCCGQGRHSLELARRGFAVTAVDRTAAYLEEGGRRADTQNLKIEFVKKVIRLFCRPNAFDTALNLYTSFGYFDDPQEDRNVLLNVHRSLKPGGTLVMDLIGKEVLARIFRERDWNAEGDAICLRETKVSRDWGWIDSRWILLKGTSRQEFSISHRLYSGTELAKLLRECGFVSVRILGDFAGAPYDHKAKRLVAIARKPDAD